MSPLERRNFFERAAQRQQFTRPRRTNRDFGQQPLDIQHAAQLGAQLRPNDGRRPADRPLLPAALRSRHDRARAAAVAAAAGVRPCPSWSDRSPRAAWHPSPAKQRLHQLQVAHAHRIQHHALGAVVIGRPVQMVERRALRLLQVMQNGSGRADRRMPPRQAAAIERKQLEVVAQRAVGVIVAEGPALRIRCAARAGSCLPARAAADRRGTALRARPSCSSGRPATSAGSSSVTRNSPVETSTCATAGALPVRRHRTPGSCSRAIAASARRSPCPA